MKNIMNIYLFKEIYLTYCLSKYMTEKNLPDAYGEKNENKNTQTITLPSLLAR